MRSRVNIDIGGLRSSREPVALSSLLGSCVSVCLHDPRTRIGGMNHILLPGQPDIVRFNDSARYGINAMELLINQMLTMGANRRSLLAKVFGGGHVLTGMSGSFSPGPGNVTFAMRFLEEERIPVISSDTGGEVSRRVVFHTDTFDVFVRRLSAAKISTLAREEMRFLARVRRSLAQEAPVTLFLHDSAGAAAGGRKP